MFTKEDGMNIIIDKLSYLQHTVEIRNSFNLTDINIHAETFCRDLFNLIYDMKLVNPNNQNPNVPFIDLIDVVNKEAIQVTSQNDSTKIKKSIIGFFQNPSCKDYTLKVFLISRKAKNYTTDFTDEGKYEFDHTKDVIDIPRLIADINNKSTDKIITIANFLNRAILTPRPKTESNEVETIMSLLEWLSNDRHYKEFDTNYECDPDKKINSRFKEYSNSFKEEFTNLYAIYCMPITKAKEAFGLDGVRAQKVSVFLKYISDRLLREANNNPQIALDNLTDFFAKKVTENGIKADSGAIRYYLLDELIGCNIFSEGKE